MVRRWVVLFICLCYVYNANAQLPVELFAGHRRTTFDLLFFRNIKSKDGKSSPWLFFNRNRLSVDYRMTQTTYLPQFGFTEAISYNSSSLKGFGMVMVVQALNTGLSPKGGFQYAGRAQNISMFTWLVCETWAKPVVDYFLLFRYTPKITDNSRLFVQVESVNAFPANSIRVLSFTQRYRVGISLSRLQFGAGGDFNQSGRKSFSTSSNMGAFFRYEFGL
jgi:hypothetical protein